MRHWMWIGLLSAGLALAACNSGPGTGPDAGAAGGSGGLAGAAGSGAAGSGGIDSGVAGSGGTGAVGSGGTDSGAAGSGGMAGAAGDGGIAEQYLKASDTNTLDAFGSSVSLSADGNTLAIGAPDENSAATGVNGDQLSNTALNSGAVYVFTRSGTQWSQQAYIKSSNTDANDYFGFGVSLSADASTFAVAAPYESSPAKGVNGQTGNGATGSGAVYVL